MTTTIVFLIKFGEEKWIDELLQNGTIYCNTIDYFRKVENDHLRNDKNECKSYIDQITLLKFKVGDKVVRFNSPAQLVTDDHFYDGNLFCITGIVREDINYALIKQIQVIKLDQRLDEFGESALLIYNIPEFRKRLIKALKKSGYKYKFSPVQYKNFKTYQGELGPFIKSDEFNFQREMRMFIENTSNDPIVLKIGNLSNIAFKAKTSEIVNGIGVEIGDPKKYSK
jgi:hypothetical protein